MCIRDSLYAVPGFLLVRRRLIAPESITGFAALLLYLCSPFQTLYAMQRIEYSPDLVGLLALALGLGALLMLTMLGAVYFVFRRRQEPVSYTHLDVYKRQTKSCSSSIWTSCTC